MNLSKCLLILGISTFGILNNSQAQLGGLLNAISGGKKKNKEETTTSSGTTTSGTTTSGTTTSGTSTNNNAAAAAEEERKKAIANRPVYGTNSSETAPVGELHQKYMNQIVFLSEPVSGDKITESMLKTKFGVNDFIYARVYAPHSAGTWAMYSDENDVTPDYNQACYVHVSVNGKEVEQAESYPKDLTSWKEFLRPDMTNSAHSKITEQLVVAFNALPAGEHTVKVEITPWLKGRIAIMPPLTGSFTVVKKEGEVAKYLRTFSGIVKPEMEDADLAAKCLKTINNFSVNDKSKVKYYKVAIVSPDWNIKKSDYGVIFSRYIKVAALGKNEDGSCIYRHFFVYQDYEGGGSYQSSVEARTLSTYAEDTGFVDCE